MTAVLVLLLAIDALIYVVLDPVQAAWPSRIGLNDVSILAAGDARMGSPTLRFDLLGLVCRPDHLVRVDGYLIPFEQKPRAQRVHNSHVMQLARSVCSSATSTAHGRRLACSYPRMVNVIMCRSRQSRAAQEANDPGTLTSVPGQVAGSTELMSRPEPSVMGVSEDRN